MWCLAVCASCAARVCEKVPHGLVWGRFVRLTYSETFGGIAPSARAHIGWLARRAKGKHGRDSTKYGLSRASTRSFYLHHTQRLSLAAILGDAKGIRRKLNGEKASRLAGGIARAAAM